MKNKKIEQIRGLVNSDKTFTPDEIAWLKKKGFNPANEKVLILAPKYTPDGPEHVSEQDRKMARQIQSKVPDMVIVELSKHDLKL